MQRIGHNVTFIKSATAHREFNTLNLPHLAFAGRSNVGKSSLINRLTDIRGLAKVSGTPGKTRLLNLFNVDDRFLLVDLPGYGYARVSKSMKEDWGRMIEQYLLEARLHMLLIFLVDSRHEPQKKDLELYRFLEDAQINYVICATKIDKLKKNQLAKNLSVLNNMYTVGHNRFFPVSSKTGEGLDRLIKHVQQQLQSIQGAHA